MAKDILLIGFFSQYQTLFFFDQVKEATKEDPSAELVLRINSEGGYPEEASSIIEKSQEMIDQIVAVKGASQLHSTALFLLAYFPAEKCECLDTTQAVLHRAAYPEWMEKGEGFKGSNYEIIRDKMNKDLEKAFRARVDVAALEALPQMAENKLTLKSIFDTSTRISVVLTGADLKKIGLVTSVNKITPAKVVAMESQYEAFKKADSLGQFKLAAKATTKEEKDEPKNENIMDLKELKEKYPAIYAAARAEGVTEGATAERDRIEAINVYRDVDAKICDEAIASGKALSAKQQAELNRKMLSADALKNLSASGKDIDAETEDVEEVEETEEEKKKGATAAKKKVSAFEAEVDKALGIKKA